MNSYQELAAHITGGRNPRARKLANNTFAETREGGEIAVRLHQTDVLTFSPSGTVTYQTGGWFTVTTKDRFNSFGPRGFRVYSNKGIWFLYGPSDLAVRFFDGLVLNPETGEILNPEDGPDFEKEDATNLELEKQIKAYVDLYQGEEIAKLEEAWKDGNTRGDCLYCQLGDGFGGTEHLTMHIEEKYLMMSLLFCAYKAKKFGDPALVLSLDMGHYHKRLRSILRGYLRSQLITGKAISTKISY